MPIIRPFHGIFYDPSVVGPLERVVAPPYDVIGREEQDRLYEASPWNVIRLDLGREDDRYESACRRFREWMASGALVRDAAPALYVCAQTYGLSGGEERARFGFFTRLHLEDFSAGKVLPHEKTLDAAKEDRLRLQRACRANLSSIFGLYSIPGWRLAEALAGTVSGPPRIEIRDLTGVHHRLWTVADPAAHADLAGRLLERTVYIADGHHRYETSLRYRDEMRAETGRRGGDEPFDYVLAFLSNMEEPGLTILATHRVLKALPIPPLTLVEELRERFHVIEVPRAAGEDGLLAALHEVPRGERRIAVVLHDVDPFLILVVREGEEELRPSGSAALRRLDVAWLHDLVLEGPGSILGLDAHDEAQSGRLVYVKDDREAIRSVTTGGAVAAFLLNPTRTEEVRAVCEAGETMPEKSTYFHPKILTGLVFNSLEE